MSMRQRIALDQLEYRKPISIANQFLDFVMQMRAQAPIRVTPNYPIGWEAEVPAEDKVWTIRCENGEIRLTKVGDFCGCTGNGKYIRLNEESISEYERYFLQENYYDTSPDMLPLTCDIFCNSNESICRFCPKERNQNRDR